MTQIPHTESFSMADKVKALCFVMHNALTPQERNAANVELAYLYEADIRKMCMYKLAEIYDICISEVNSEEVENLKDACLDTLMKKAWDYDPEHSSHANLLSYAQMWIKNTIKLETNKGMTEAEINNLCKIHKAIKKYEEINETSWSESDENYQELSAICELSVKVIKKTLALKKELRKQKSDSLDRLVGDEEGKALFELQEDNRYSPEAFYEKKMVRSFLNSLTDEEKAILYSMVNVEDNYKAISEREGVLILQKHGYMIGRGTLKNRREALRNKVRAFLNEECMCDFLYAA